LNNLQNKEQFQSIKSEGTILAANTILENYFSSKVEDFLLSKDVQRYNPVKEASTVFHHNVKVDLWT